MPGNSKLFPRPHLGIGIDELKKYRYSKKFDGVKLFWAPTTYLILSSTKVQTVIYFREIF